MRRNSRANSVAVPDQEIKHTRGETSLHDQLAHEECGKRSEFGALHDDCVARSECGANFPTQHEDYVVF